VVHSASPERTRKKSVLQVSSQAPDPDSNQLIAIHFSRVKTPEIYKSTYGEICKADATAVDLGRLNKHFYELGRYVAHFDRNGFVGKMIYEVGWLFWRQISSLTCSFLPF